MEKKIFECVLRKPYTPEEIIKMMDENNYISGIIQMPLSAIAYSDMETFLDTISEKLVGDYLLSDIRYKPIGTIDNDVLIKVSGAIEDTEITEI